MSLKHVASTPPRSQRQRAERIDSDRRFKQEKGRLPSLTAIDPWEKRMAEGVAFLQRKVKEEKDA